MLPVLMSDFRPPNIPGLKMWLDASRIQGLADGAAVTVWPDLPAPGSPFFDSFDRADSATTMGAQWAALSGTWGISTNQAYLSVDGGGNKNVAVIDSGLSDCAVQATFAAAPTSESCRLAFRFTDVDNGFILNAMSGSYTLYRRQGGAYTAIGAYATTPANGDVVRVVLVGSSIKVQVNGTERISATDGFNQSATKHGIGSNGSTLARFNDFLVSRLTDAVQTTQASKPTFKVGVQNGRPVVRFDGGDTLRHEYANQGAPYTAFAVAVRNGGSAGYQDVIQAGVPMIVGKLTGVENWGGFHNAVLMASKSLTGAFNVVSACARSYNDLDLVTNGSAERRTNGTSWLYDAAGARQYIGSYNGNTEFFTGDIAEIIVYAGALTTPQRRKVERYLAKKWGINLTRQVVEDTFTRADSAVTLGNMETGHAWTVQSQTWGVSGGKAYQATSAGGGIATVDAGTLNCVVSADITSDSWPTKVGNIVCRFIDISNYLRVQIDGSTVYLVSVNNGSTSTLASVSAALTNGVTYNLRVVINGTAVSVFVDGTQKLTFTLSGSDASVFSQAVATKFGFRTGGGGDVSTMRFDNFTVEV